MLKPITCLTFADGADAAAKFYVTLFQNSRIVRTTYTPAGLPVPEGSVMLVELELDGMPLMCLNGGPHFKLTDAMSLSVSCKSQQEIDDLWAKLTEQGGKPGPCGWCTDRFGVSWQVVPEGMPGYFASDDPARAKRVADAMQQMQKLDIRGLEAAAHAHAA